MRGASLCRPKRRPAIVSCGSGVTACHDALAMVIAGRELPDVYVGSFSEWSGLRRWYRVRGRSTTPKPSRTGRAPSPASRGRRSRRRPRLQERPCRPAPARSPTDSGCVPCRGTTRRSEPAVNWYCEAARRLESRRTCRPSSAPANHLPGDQTPLALAKTRPGGQSSLPLAAASQGDRHRFVDMEPEQTGDPLRASGAPSAPASSGSSPCSLPVCSRS